MLTVFLSLAFAARGGMPAEYREYQVKAIWMLNFTRYVDWPASTFATKEAPCIVGVLGKDPFGDELEAAFMKKAVKGRPFVLRRVNRDTEVSACHMLFVPAAERRTWRDMQATMSKAPVLTIGEADGFLDQGGIINFLIKDASIAFEIDLRAAQRAGIKFDANLLKIAAKVKGKYE